MIWSKHWLSHFSLSAVTQISNNREAVEKLPGRKCLELWKSVEIFAGVARGQTFGGQIWCQGARQPQQIQPSHSLYCSSSAIFTWCPCCDLSTPSQSQHANPQTRKSLGPLFPAAVLQRWPFQQKRRPLRSTREGWGTCQEFDYSIVSL